MFSFALLLACPSDRPARPSRHHPEEFALPEHHGMAAKAQDEACAGCHGGDLAGGTSGVSCDTCHAADWRTDCTFCHGGTVEGSGAPPRDIDGATTDISFPPHTAHVTTNLHSAYDCGQCHRKPEDALTVGHVFLDDQTPGVSEMDFSSGLSASATWDGAGGCSNLYCHGNGRTEAGKATVGQDFSGCDACHASDASSAATRASMSGDHVRHFDEGIACWECHQGTLDEAGAIRDPSLHVNGVADILLPASMTRKDNGQCEGSCHSEGHGGRTW